VIKTPDKFSLFGPAGNGGISRRLQDQFGLLEGVVLMKVSQELQEPDVPRQVEFTDTAKHPLTTRIFLLRMIDEPVRVSFYRPVAAGRVGVEPAARVDGKVSSLLHRLHREIAGRLEDDSPLATDPRDHRWPVCVIMATAGLTLLAAPTGSAPQRLLSSMFRLAFLTRGVLEVIRFNRALSLTLHLRGERGMASPPAPAIAGPDMEAHFPGNAPGGTGKTQQKGREYPVGQWPCALMQQGRGAVVEGALAALAPVALAPGPVVVLAPRIALVTVASGTLERAIFPPQCVDIGLTVFSAEELVHRGEHRHDDESPGA
jgi:hypothetical protein